MNKHVVAYDMLPWDILQTAQVLFRSKGFDHTRIDDITESLDISEALFFRCFESLDEVLELLWSDVSKEKILSHNIFP